MSNFYTYDPSGCTIIYNGAVLCGFADGDFLEIGYESENFFTDSCSADGFVTRVLNSDRRGNITVKLHRSSPINKILSTFAKVDFETQSGAGAFLFKDGKGETLVAGANCYIPGWPKSTHGKELGVLEWRIKVAHLEVFYA